MSLAVGTVLRSHAGGYVVHLPQKDEEDFALFCQARGRLKKERVAIVTGDRVELDEINLLERTAVIVQHQERKTFIDRPPLANVDQVVIVQAVRQPDFNPLWMDRYLVHFQLAVPFSRPIICLNKCDLEDESGLLRLRSIYEPLGYFVICASATTGFGLEELAAVLSGKVSVFSGPSGVGKSSLLNRLSPGLDIKVGRMENEFGVGRHTTTYSELYRLNIASPAAPASAPAGADHSSLDYAQEERFSWVADTPGFNVMEFMQSDPRKVAEEFPEIFARGQYCKYADCLHLVEAGCAVLAALSEAEDGEVGEDVEEVDEIDEIEEMHASEESFSESANQINAETGGQAAKEIDEKADHELANQIDLEVGHKSANKIDAEAGDESANEIDPEAEAPIAPSRYESYCLIVNEARAMEEAARSTSSKKESAVKSVGGDKTNVRIIPRLSGRYRASSRRTEKQKLPRDEEFDDKEESDDKVERENKEDRDD